jgi:outer membrane lipoprotein carrier protein
MKNVLLRLSNKKDQLNITPHRFKNRPMKKLPSLLCFSLFMIFSGTLSAQNDPKAKGILDEVSKKTKTYKTISASFALSITDKDKKNTDKQEGNLMVKGSKYKVEIAGQTIISDGKTVWTYLKESNEVQINNAEANEDNDKITPTNIFTIYEKGFKYEFVKEETTKSGAVIQQIKLFPLDPKKKNYHTAIISIDKAKKQITSMQVMMKDGSTSLYTVKKFTTNTEIADGVFTFDKAKYPKVEVVDLRE